MSSAWVASDAAERYEVRGRSGTGSGETLTVKNFADKVQFVWSIAELLRGPYKPPQYGRVILPLTVLRRLDCVLVPTKEKVLAKAAGMKGSKVENIEPILNRVAGQTFHNASPLDFQKLAIDLLPKIAQMREVGETFSDSEVARIVDGELGA